jgi:hypothetical protein
VELSAPKLMSNDRDYYKNKYVVVKRIRSSDIKRKVVANIVGVVLLLIVTPFVLTMIHGVSSLESSLQLLLILPLLAIVFLLLHERLHYIALWWFSKKRPELQCFSVLLNPDSSVTKMGGLISYLFPLLVISTAFIVISFFVGPTLHVVFLTVGLMHMPQCCYDLVDSFALLTCDGMHIRIACEKNSQGFEMVFFQYN